MVGGVVQTTPRAKKSLIANPTSIAYPPDVLERSAKLSFDRQVPVFQRRVLPRDFPASYQIFLERSVLSIYPNVAYILPVGGVAGRLRNKNSPMGQKYKEETQLQSFSRWSLPSDSGVGHGRGQRGMGVGVIPFSRSLIPSLGGDEKFTPRR